MSEQDHDFQSIQEIGKIYASLTERKVLVTFFLESVCQFVLAESGYLYLSGREEQIWLESSCGPVAATKELEQQALKALRVGKPALERTLLFLPLIVRNTSMGIACFSKKDGEACFSPRDLDLGFGLANQAAGVLKNILLFEENIKMERLAAVGQTIGMVMHEIKNIMQIAKLSDEFIKRGLQENNRKFLDRGLEKMAKALKEMDGFVWDMLGLTKDYQLEPEIVNLRDLVNELGQDIKERAADFKVGLDFSVDEEIAAVEGDNRSLYRALLNLVKNAIEACAEKDALVKVRARLVDAEHYEITVEDNGDGMNDETKARIFQAFYSTKGKKGTGLGLMIIEKAVRMHHGRIEVESELGKGTRFILTLPRRFVHPAQEMESPA